MDGIKEVLSTRKYKAGYEIRKELVDGTPYGSSDIEIKSAYTQTGAYIGKSREAYRLCKKRGIKPEVRTPDSNVCSIGFCEEEQKWYGWSHRAIYGFGVGSEVKKGSCAYTPTTKDDFKEDMIRFWHDPEIHEQTLAKSDYIEDGINGVQIYWRYTDKVKNEKLRGKISAVFQSYPDEYGRGEWVAKNLVDARQMACDFAEGVS